MFELISSSSLDEEEKALQQVRSWLREGFDIFKLNYAINKELAEHYAKKGGEH